MHHESSTQSTLTQDRATRRALIRGSLAAPLVMTVTSATGAARTTFSACLDNAKQQPKPHRVLARSHYADDDWLRVQIDLYEISLPDGKGKLVQQPGKYFVGPDKNTLFKLADFRPDTAPPTAATRFTANTPGLHRQLAGKRYALAYADPQGKVVGYGWQDNGGTHCKKSCFSSVVARAADRRRRV